MKIYNADSTSRNVVISDDTRVHDVIRKSNDAGNIQLSLVEALPNLFMERLLEDDHKVWECIQMWATDSENCLMICERKDKYDIFTSPQNYFTRSSEQKNSLTSTKEKQILLQEYVNSNFMVPDCDGMLYLKIDGRKSWKKLYFILRPSGIYYSPKGKSKSLMDLVCLQQLYNVEVYTGINWKKKFKAPTDFCFSLKHPKIQRSVPKYIKYFCADDEATKYRWINFIRLAKHGKQMYKNFLSAKSFEVEKTSIDSTRNRNFSQHELSRNNQIFSNETFLNESSQSFERLSSSSIHSFHPNSSFYLAENNARDLGLRTMKKENQRDLSPRSLQSRAIFNHSSKKQTVNERLSCEPNGHVTIKRALSSRGEKEKSGFRDSSCPRSCPQSPRAVFDITAYHRNNSDDSWNIAETILGTNGRSKDFVKLLEPIQMLEITDPDNDCKNGFTSKRFQTEHFYESRDQVEHNSRRFAMLAGSFKERLTNSYKCHNELQHITKNKNRSETEKLKYPKSIKFGSPIEEETVEHVSIGEDFDCLPPPPAELLSGFLKNTSTSPITTSRQL